MKPTPNPAPTRFEPGQPRKVEVKQECLATYIRQLQMEAIRGQRNWWNKINNGKK